ncbi:recombination regulator RecX [Candidatus Gracilibacteria bacterium]|nr:recombination regulator RecX [Candidatus Gracilibacteria bacterium]MCF7819795.1 recombination regulator RecX [Candidatus Gracilibacteria bacterium]
MEEIRNQAFRVLARREHSVYELKGKLSKKFPEQAETIAQVVKEFQEQNWISDDRFCEAFIREKILTNNWGTRKIFFQLHKKGIAKDLAQEKMKTLYSEEEQQTILQELIEKKHQEIIRKGKTKNEYEVRQKLLAYLVGKGFEFEIAKKAIDYFSPV